VVTSFSAERDPPQGKRPQQDEKERERMARARSWNVVFMIGRYNKKTVRGWQ